MKGTRPIDAKVNSMLIFSVLRGVAGLQTACEHSGHGGSCSECNVWCLRLGSLEIRWMLWFCCPFNLFYDFTSGNKFL